jgi:hypothetical protein
VMNDEETSTLELFGTEAAQAYASEQRRLKDVRNAGGAVPVQQHAKPHPNDAQGVCRRAQRH